ncbi:MAG: hypothetical protein IMZ58_10610 [Thermoplasmata archaeon]|nr:hypothetical protein [Thermoplasmata archaeon]
MNGTDKAESLLSKPPLKKISISKRIIGALILGILILAIPVAIYGMITGNFIVMFIAAIPIWAFMIWAYYHGKKDEKALKEKKRREAEKAEKKQREEKEKAGIIREFEGLHHIEGIPLLAGVSTKLMLYKDKLSVIDIRRNKTYNVFLKNILDVKVKNENEISEQERSVIKRAIAGGIIGEVVLGAGGLGAIVGGMSGVPKKQIVNHNYFLSIEYLSKEGNKNNMLFVKNAGLDPNNTQRAYLNYFADNTVEQIRIIKPLDENEKGEVEL